MATAVIRDLFRKEKISNIDSNVIYFKPMCSKRFGNKRLKRLDILIICDEDKLIV